MEDLGAPIAYLALAEGVPVFAADGTPVGKVEHVLAAEDKDIFDGIVIDADGHRFVDAPEVGDIFERGVVLALTAEQVGSLPEPTENAPVIDVAPGDEGGSPLQQKLRRAWDLVSGNY